MAKELQLSKGYTAIVDDEDYEWASQFKWHYHKGYAVRCEWDPVKKKNRHIMLHREIMNAKRGKVVDHKNSNTLDCQRENLRVTCQQKNIFNKSAHRGSTSQYKGVHLDRNRGKWVSQISINGSKKFLGRFDTEIEAAKAYNKEAARLFGRNAKINIL